MILRLLGLKSSIRKKTIFISFLIFGCYLFFINVALKKKSNVTIHLNSLEYDNFTFIFNPEFTCSKRPPYLSIIIKSRVDHFFNREILRRTWAQQDEHGFIRRVFTLGLPKPSNESETIIAKLKTENFTFGDMIQQNFYDDYYNNTLKTMMGIRWASEFCSKVLQVIRYIICYRISNDKIFIIW